MKFNFILTVFCTLGLAACNSSSGAGGSAANTDPELQKPALETRIENSECEGEDTILNQEKDDETYYTFHKYRIKSQHKISVHENGVERRLTTGTSEYSTCDSYQDHCNQTWFKNTVSYTADNVVRESNPKSNQILKQEKVKKTTTLVSTDHEEYREYINKPISRSSVLNTLVRVDGNNHYILNVTTDNTTMNVNEAEVKVLTVNGSSKTERTFVLKPYSYKESDATITVIKGEETCTFQIQ